jgi:choline monooxygenase
MRPEVAVFSSPSRNAPERHFLDLTYEINAFDIEPPAEHAVSLPRSWYLEPEIAALEAAAVLGLAWRPLGFGSQLAAAGDWVASRPEDPPLVAVRGADGVLRGFENVCRHRGSVLLEGAGRCERIVCPYHAWSYALDGALAHAPRAPDLAPGMRLPQAALREWGPLVLGCATEPGADLTGPIAELDRALAPSGWERLVHVASRTYLVGSNWKVFVENYLDGGYHVAPAHPELAAQLDLASYEIEIGDRCVLQRVAARGTDARVAGGAVYAWLYPDLMLNRYGPWLDVNRVVPLGPQRCRVHFDWLAEPGLGRAAIEPAIAASEAIQQEDAQLCAGVQRGLRAPGWTPGPYMEPERGMHAFHRWLAEDLRRALHAGDGSDQRSP